MDRYAWFRIVRFLASWPRPIAYWLGERGGDLSRIFDLPKREAVHENLRVVLGPGATTSEIRRTAKLVFRSFGRYFAEFFGTRTFGGDFIYKRLRLVNAHHIDRAIAGGTGAVILTAHLANWEIGAAVLASRGYDVFGVAEHHSDPRLKGLFQAMRASRGYTTIPYEGSFRPCVRALREGRSICFVGDRDIGVGGVEVEFFGRPTLFPEGPARIALAAGASVVPGFVIRQSDCDLTVTMEPPIEEPVMPRGGDNVVDPTSPPVKHPREGDRKHKARVMTQRFANLVERYVRARPEQWGVFDRVWDEDKPTSAAEGGGYDDGC